MRDTTTITRPYFREGTDALASLVATRPARDVLLNVAAELQHRERPAARRLAATVAELLGGVSAIGQASEPVAMPVPAEVAPATDFTGTSDATIRRIIDGHASMAESARGVRPDMAAAHDGWKAQAEAEIARRDAAKPARKPAAPKVKGPGDIGWKPRSLDQIARSAGLAPLSWDAETHSLFPNVMLAMREHGLMARGFEHGGPAGDGCTTWKRGADRILVGPYGALYLADGTMRQLPREERDAITEDGRAGVAAAVERKRNRGKRAAADVKAAVAWLAAKGYSRNARMPNSPTWARSAKRDAVAHAWKLRAEARAI
jgi:hypothetical protein